MKCGVAILAMNDQDVERCSAEDWSRPPDVADHVLWEKCLALGDLVEPLGFDSIWTVEHFATPYCMVPSALQHLAYWAGRTEKLDMGTCVVVAPWHHPVQLAHEISMLDVLLKGRRYTVGLGRGLSPKEYAPLGVPQDEARQRFKETLDVLKLGLTLPRFSYEGEIFKIPETSVRPAPRHRDLMDTAVGAFLTKESLEVVARSGLGHIVVTAASYEQVGRDNILFNQYRQEVGLAPDALPIIYIIGAYCAETEEKAQKGHEYLAALGTVGAYHYGFSGPNLTDFSKIKGYESYAKGLPGASQSAPDPEAARRAAFVGTPDQLIEKVQRIRTESGAREIVIAFDVVGSMPYEDAQRSMSLFAREVLPAVHEIQVGPPAVLAGGPSRPE